MKNVKIDKSWKKVLETEFQKSYWEELTEFVRQQYLSSKVYPPAKNIFRAFDLCPLNKVKVVITMVLNGEVFHFWGNVISNNKVEFVFRYGHN
jgi:hypothetical protein